MFKFTLRNMKRYNLVIACHVSSQLTTLWYSELTNRSKIANPFILVNVSCIGEGDREKGMSTATLVHDHPLHTQLEASLLVWESQWGSRLLLGCTSLHFQVWNQLVRAGTLIVIQKKGMYKSSCLVSKREIEREKKVEREREREREWKKKTYGIGVYFLLVDLVSLKVGKVAGVGPLFGTVAVERGVEACIFHLRMVHVSGNW